MMLVQVISLYFIGNLGVVKMTAGAGLATMIINLCLSSILYGSTQAMETLVSQAYGKDDQELMISYMKRGRMIEIFLFIALACILWFTEPILIFLQQDAEVAHYAAQYTRISLPGIFFQQNFNYLRRYMLQMNLVKMPMIIIMGTTIGHIFWCNLFVTKLGWGIAGGAWALTMTSLLNFILL